MITHDPEEVNQFTDRNIHLVRDQSSPWRCFNVHDTEGRVTMLDLFQYDFMQRALVAMVAMSLFSPVLGIFLILRTAESDEWYLESRLSCRVSLLGFSLGSLPTLSTMIIVIIAAVFLEYLRTLFKDFMEIGTANSNVHWSCPSFGTDAWWWKSSMSLDQYLFGSTLTITDEQVIALFVIAFVVLVLTALFRWPMYIWTFDDDTAFVDGLRSDHVHLI